MRKYRQGLFKPINPKKYLGDPTNIVYRSSWELKLLKYLDLSEHVLAYGSEETVIPYISPLDNRYHRYFIDFIVVNKDRKVLLIEVKPYAQTLPPKQSKGMKKERLLKETTTYLVNQAKWNAAKEFCKNKGWEFVVLTERDINFK